ncbi:MAG: ParA family protein [Steroidobacteraceae bacterium]
MQKIVVLNPKGGSGKSTLATNLASYFAVQNCKPTLMDMDAQGSSMRWVGKRSTEQPRIYGVAGYERKMGVTRSFAMRMQMDSEVLIVDTPAAVEAPRLPEFTRDAHAILVPVLPSDIDIHAATRCISDLLLVAKVNRNEQRIAVIANRVKRHTIMYRSLMQFLHTLQIPVLATLRDSQNYVRAYERGQGIFEMKPMMVHEDLEQWQPLLGWLSNMLPGRQAISPPSPTIARPTSFGSQTVASQIKPVNPVTTPVEPKPQTASGTQIPAFLIPRP